MDGWSVGHSHLPLLTLSGRVVGTHQFLLISVNSIFVFSIKLLFSAGSPRRITEIGYYLLY